MRLRINDMDPLNLRLRLPDVIAQMHKEVTAAGPGLIYVHCTAGMCLPVAPSTPLAVHTCTPASTVTDIPPAWQTIRHGFQWR